MRLILRLSHGIDRFVLAIGKLASVFLLLLAALILLDVLSRGSAWANSTRLQELEWHVHAGICFFVFAYTMVSDRHVRVELLRDHWSAKRRAYTEIAGLLFLFLPMVLVVLYYSTLFAHNAWVAGEASPSATGLSHRWIIKACQPIGFALLLLAGISRLLRQVIAVLPAKYQPSLSDTKS